MSPFKAAVSLLVVFLLAWAPSRGNAEEVTSKSAEASKPAAIKIDEGEIAGYVADKPVTVKDIMLFWRSGVANTDLDKPDEMVKSVPRLFNNLALADAANSELPKDVKRQAVARSSVMSDEAWRNLYFDEKIVPKIKVSDKELLDLVGPQKDVYRVQGIIMQDRAKLEKVRAEVLKGVPPSFDERLKTENDPIIAEKNGEIFIDDNYDRFSKETVKLITGTPKDTYTEVIEIPLGYGFFKVADMRTADQVRHVKAETQRTEYTKKKMLAEFEVEKESLWEKYKVEVDLESVKAYEKAKKAGDKKRMKELEAKPLVRMGGETMFDLGDFLEVAGYKHSGDINVKYVVRSADSMVLKKALLEEASKGLENSRRFKEVSRYDEIIRANYLARFLNDWKARDIQATDEELRAYFKEHEKEFSLPDRRRFSYVESKNTKRIENARKEYLAGKPMKDVAWKWSDDVSKDRGGDIGYLTRDVFPPPLDEMIWNLKVGEASEPMNRLNARGERVWTFLVVTEVSPAHQMAFEEVDKDLITSRVLAKKKTAISISTLDKAAKTVKIVIGPERIREVAVQLTTRKEEK